MEGDYIKINPWLLPLSWLYGIGVSIRNELFELGILKSRSFSIPVISVGNITVGGSGKTPHVEYLIRLLGRAGQKVSVLSRGYKRKSEGYVLGQRDKTSMEEIGDEPYQMLQKFPDIHIAVDKDRCHGIDTLLASPETSDTDVVLLDDAYQHRYVKPGINILLVDYHRLFTYDKLLPAGRLREPVSGKSRADIVIITKCPTDLKPVNFRVLQKAMDLRPYQCLYYSTLRYGTLHHHSGAGEIPLDKLPSDTNILLLTGIGEPRQIVDDLRPYCPNVSHMGFDDHHDFTPEDIQRINDEFARIPSPRMVVTTEKDHTRLATMPGLSPELQKYLYILPIEVEFMQGGKEEFEQKILSYVGKNSKTSTLTIEAEKHKAQKESRRKPQQQKTTTIKF